MSCFIFFAASRIQFIHGEYTAVVSKHCGETVEIQSVDTAKAFKDEVFL